MEEFDFIIVGCGSAGSVLAGRLSDSGASVCVLESGPADSSFWILFPAGLYKINTNPALTWPYECAGPAGTGRRFSVRHGRVLGGSGAINGMVMNRGAARDYDSWAQVGNSGWSYSDTLPYFMRMESRIGQGDDRIRGREGPLPVTDSTLNHPLCQAFREAAMAAGVPSDFDANGPRPDGIAVTQCNVLNGRRVTSSNAYLHPALRKNKGLTVRTDSHAIRLTLDGRRAVGVNYVRGTDHGTEFEVRARREVILSSGAIATPRLLQVSGIGPAKVLHDIGVPVVHALAGVGENLHDHYRIRAQTRIKNMSTLNNIANSPRLIGELVKWVMGKPSIVGAPPWGLIAALRSEGGLDSPDVTIFFSPIGFHSTSRKISPIPGANCTVYPQRPISRGYVRAAGPDPFALPIIEPNYLAEEKDRRALIGGVRMTGKIFATPPFSQFLDGEEFPGHSAATDDEVLEFARKEGGSSHHFVGSCRMAPSTDPLSVVDDQLRVHGIENLRVVDASIMPNITSGNTNAATMMIAEKASDMILGRPTLPPVIFEA